MLEIFKVFGSVFLKGGPETEKELNGLDKKAGGLGSTFSKVGGSILKGGAIIGGAALAAGGALVGMAKKSADSADRVNDLSAKMGMSKKGFQEWDFVLKQNGSSIDAMSMGMKTLTNSAQEAMLGTGKGAESFKKLGINIKDSNGKLKDQETLFNETIEALQGVENATERAGLANDLLGKSGMELGPVLNLTAGEVANLKKEANDLGIVMSDKDIEAGGELADTFEKLTATIGGMVNTVLAPLLPLVKDVIDNFIKFVPVIMDALKPAFEKLLPPLMKIVEKLLPPLLDLFFELMPILDPVIDIILMLVDTALVPLIDLFSALLKIVLPPLMWYIENIVMPVWKALFDIIGTVIGGIVDAIEWLGKLFKKKESVTPGTNETATYTGSNSIDVIGKKGRVTGGQARGTSFISESGMYRVGENFPEEVFLPRGASVNPMAGNRGESRAVIININDGKFFNESDARKFGQLMYKHWQLGGVGKAI